MVWPLGSVNASVQPLIAELPVLATVMLAVSPVFHVLVVYVTRQPLAGGGLVGGGDVGGGEVGGGLVGGGEVGPPLSPKNAMAIAAWPWSGRLCPTPWMLMPSTGAWVPVPP